MTTASAKKCAHPPCTCEAKPGKEFCSEDCVSPDPSNAGKCQCGHPGCQKNH